MFDYCMDCGAKMIPVKVSHKHRYSSLTGQKAYSVKLRCPNKRWYKPFTHLDWSASVDSKAEAEKIEVEIRDRAGLKK